MRKMTNSTHIEGFVYDHKLERKVSGPKSKNPGTEFISGNLQVATDNAGMNVVTVHFSYVTATTKNGGANATFAALASIIDGKVGTVMANGQDNAGKVRIDSALDLNEFYTDRNGQEELVSAKRNEGGFVHMVSSIDENEAKRATFDEDFLINGVREVEEDEEKGIKHHLILKGCVFNFRNEMLPVEFSVYHPGAISYFLDQEISQKNPMFTYVSGQQVSTTIIRCKEEASAFGDTKVTETKSTQREFVVTWAQAEPYAWDDESTILATELSSAIAARQVKLAEVKARQDEYKASKNNAPSAFPSPTNAPAAAATTVYDF